MTQQKRKTKFFTRVTKEEILRVYNIGESIGSGNFSTVKIGKDRKTGEKWAIKVIRKEGMGNNLRMLENEIDILSRIDHPNIITLKEIYETKDKVYLVMEYCDKGELFDDIVEEGFYAEEKASKLIYKILMALKYLHQQGIAHRDLKPENLLLSGKNKEIKIADFGLSKIYSEKIMLKTACGTPGYVAPEILDEDMNSYGPKVDVWSVGVITYIMLCGYPPFYNENTNNLFKQILSGEFEFPEEDWSKISEEAKQFISKIFVVDSSSRMSVEQALKHPWILNHNPKKKK
ncbi:serine/threonine-protein kinase fhke-related [Anaeramoeba flamelloides]|uniref:Serine/threonine-protein kinase fhke-related n=1 Tax=Anaeramoeba flamelloides TaxID=1746091 RepID=A0ABQ8YBQ0_9EUKA|nr:serine/threonine-protein kinase fhke-related [Anaeramoeba flamelloides]